MRHCASFPESDIVCCNVSLLGSVQLARLNNSNQTFGDYFDITHVQPVVVLLLEVGRRLAQFPCRVNSGSGQSVTAETLCLK